MGLIWRSSIIWNKKDSKLLDSSSEGGEENVGKGVKEEEIGDEKGAQEVKGDGRKEVQNVLGENGTVWYGVVRCWRRGGNVCVCHHENVRNDKTKRVSQSEALSYFLDVALFSI